MNILYVLLVIVFLLVWFVITYIIPLVAIVCIFNGVQLAWIPLCIWLIGIVVNGIIREIKGVENDNKKSRK